MQARREARIAKLTIAAVAMIAIVAGTARANAQAYPYPAQNDAQGNPYPQQYQQPQYQEPQYAQPQYGADQPQYGQPQAQQPQYPVPQDQYAGNAPYDQQQNYAQAQSGPVQALSADQLEQMLAPIALYPDALLAQILAASTYPAQVATANQWLQQAKAQGYNSPDQIAAGANAQTTWDPSVKALTAFPDVLDMLDRNLQWTTELGNAYYNQPQDVMQTVQVLRDRADQSGALQSTPQEQVSDDQGYIDIAPTNPDVVYVPTYDPWEVYGGPIIPYPGFAYAGLLGNFYYGGLPIWYGLGFEIGAFERVGFGWNQWGCDWGGRGVLYGRNAYYTHSGSVRDWGLRNGGPRAVYGRGGNGWQGNGNGNRAWNGPRGGQQGGFDRGGNGFNRGAGQAPGQSFARPSNGVPFNAQRNDGMRGAQPAMNSFTRANSPARQAYAGGGPQSSMRAAPQVGYGYRTQPQMSRPQSFNSPVYGSGYGNRATPNFGSRPSYATQPSYANRGGMAFASPAQSFRAPQMSAPRGFSGGSRGFSNERPAQNFGGGRAQSFGGGGGGGHASAPKFSSGGQANGGGHSGGGGGHRR